MQEINIVYENNPHKFIFSCGEIVESLHIKNGKEYEPTDKEWNTLSDLAWDEYYKNKPED